MLFLHCPLSDVADLGVVGFSDQYIDAADGSAALLFLMKNIADEGIRHLSDIQGIGKSNGGFQTAKLLDLPIVYMYSSLGNQFYSTPFLPRQSVFHIFFVSFSHLVLPAIPLPYPVRKL